MSCSAGPSTSQSCYDGGDFARCGRHLSLPPDGANYSKRCWSVQENKIDVAILTKTPWIILVLPADGHHIITADVANDKPYALRLELCECSVNLNSHLGKTFDLKIHTRQTNL